MPSRESRRKRMGRYWAYFDAEGNRITDRDEIDRLNAIGLPPAYTRTPGSVPIPTAICRRPAWMREGRKQYRYHADFRARRESAKYEGLLEFGKALPRLRRRVEQDLKRRTLTPRNGARRRRPAARRRAHPHRQRGICEGEQELRRDHAAKPPLRRKGQSLMMRFAGKHGIVHEVDDHRHQSEAHLQALPGAARPDAVPVRQRRRRAEARSPRATSTTISSEASGGDFTAKHFRTWSASVIAFDQLLQEGRERADHGQDGGRAGRRSARQHARDQPQVLRPPGAARGGQGRSARSARRHGAAARAQAPVERGSRPARLPRQNGGEAQAVGGRPPKLDRCTPNGNQAAHASITGQCRARPISTGREASSAVVDWFAVNQRRAADRHGRRGGRSSCSCSACGCGGERLVARRSGLSSAGAALSAGSSRRPAILFMVAAALDMVATYAALPHAHRAAARHPLHHRLRAAGRDLGARADPRRDQPQGRRRRPSETALGNAMAIIRVLVSVALVRHRDHRHPRQSRASTSPPWSPASASAASPSASPRRASSPTCSRRSRSCSTSRSSAATRSATTRRTGTVERIGLKTTRLRSIDGEQVVMANTKLLEREIHNFAGGRSAALASLPFGLIYQTNRRISSKRSSRSPRGRSKARKGCKFVRCAILRFGPVEHRLRTGLRRRQHRSEQGCRRPHRRRPRRACARSPSTGWSSPIRPRPPSPPRPTARWSCPMRRQPNARHCAPIHTPANKPDAVASLDEIRAAIGNEIGVSSWLDVDQARIDAFADATEDRQFIHVDPAAAAQTPFGGTIAHGFLTLSLLSRMARGGDAHSRRRRRWRSTTASTASASSRRSAPAAACAAASRLTRSRRKRRGKC